MAKKVIRKDFYMEIRKSPGRFLSILFIVALGVAFFSGIRASEPDMRITGDAYFDNSELMDIKALSTYGVTEDDVKAMEELSGVRKAEGAYSADFLYWTGDEQHVLHVMGIQEEMNQTTVTKGRLPEKTGECLADDESEYQIGDEITLESGTDDPISDTLKTDTFKVVGRGNNPCYLSYGRGSTTIGTGSVSAFIIIPQETFELDVYTEVYLQVEGAKGLLAFTDAYDDKIETVVKEAEKLSDERGRIRKQEITDEAEEELADAKEELKDGKAEAKKELADAKEKITDAEKKLADGKKELADGKKELADAKNTLESKQKELDKAKAEYNAGKKELKKSRKEYKKGLKEYEAQKEKAQPGIENGKQQAAALQVQISEDETTYLALTEKLSELESIEGDPGEELKQQILGLKTQAEGILQKIVGEKQAYEAIEEKLEQAEKQLEEGASKLAKAKKKLEAGEKKLKGVPEKLKSGQNQIDQGWKEIEKQEKKLEEGAGEIADNEKKIRDAKEEYEDGKKEAEEEIRDGERKIKDAEKEISEIENPKWYVYDRSTLVEYSGFGENAERIGALGKVFPILFFLVAALISLTNMTRMVEEQRTSIGTMKALGYGKGAIASKYLGYAFCATIGGSILGVLVGEKVLPFIIVYAYGILYRHLPEIIVPYNWAYAFMASGAAIICTIFATWMACYRELQAQPAVLMRPPTPKNGRRVFLEQIPVIWKRLSFTWKSTIRNLMRYKKRFFMTIFGIGGCMALMLVGFGLKDSCYEIAELQYADIQMYDGNIYLEEDVTDKQRENIKAALEKEKDIETYTDVKMQNITLMNGKKEHTVYECVFESVKDVSKFVDFHDRKTKKPCQLSDDGVIISEKTGKLLDAKEGDTIFIKDDEKGSKKVKVEHICENYMGHYMYMTPAYYEKVYKEEPEYNSICMIASDECTTGQIEEIGQRMLLEEGALSVSYTHDIEKQLADMLRSLNLVIIVLIISAGMLAFVVLYNLNTVNIAERKRELATLKVLGFYDSEVAEYVYRENMILTFIGAFVGVGLGKLLHGFVIETVEVDSAMFGRNINMPSYIYSLLFTVAFSLLINGIMYFKLKKIDMVESLKSIE